MRASVVRLVIPASLDISLAAHYALLTSADCAAIEGFMDLQAKAAIMHARPDLPNVSLALPERIVAQLDELVRHGHFANRQAAVAAAVERLHADEKTQHLTARQAAFTRLCGALRLGTTRQSLRRAELDRLTWESGRR